MSTMSTKGAFAFHLALLSTMPAGCDEESTSAPEELQFRATTRSEVATPGDPDGGIFINNGLDDPDVSGVNPAYGLSTNEGLDPAGDLLADPDRRDTIEYLVECALPPGASITKVVDGEPLEFDGQIGLAPEWEDGECDEDCQEWVSACLLARTNVSGQTVSLWMRADHPAIGTGTSLRFPVYEASFFGNLFDGSGQKNICQGSVASSTVAFLDGRTCSAELGESCGFTKHNDCELAPRCTFWGLLQPTAVGCAPPSGAPYHTITTYISAI